MNAIDNACVTRVLPGGRRKLLMLVPHEPTLDPRVHYTAESLAKKFTVTVLSTVREFEQRPAENDPQNPPYTIVRVPLRHRRQIAMGYGFVKIAMARLLGANDSPLVAVSTVILLVLGGLVAVALALAMLAVEMAVIVVALPVTVVGRAVARNLKPISPFLVVTPLGYYGLRRMLRMSPRFAAALRGLSRGAQISASVFRYTFAANATLLDCIAARSERPDYLYCHDLYCLQAAVAIKLRQGGRIIYDSHEYYPYLYHYPIFVWLTRLYEGMLVKFVDTYITVSPQLAEELKRDYDRREVIAIPNVEPCPQPAVAPLHGEISDLAGERLKMLYQGSFAEGRGLEEIIEEWRTVDGTRAAFFLRGPANPVRDNLEAQAKRLGLLGESVYFLAPVLERDLIAAAREADIGIIPYKTDSKAYRFACPNKLSQYIHAGLGILANSLPFVRDLVEEHRLGICYDIAQPGSFARAIGGLIDDRGEVSTFKRNAERASRQSYCWEKYEETLLASVDVG